MNIIVCIVALIVGYFLGLHVEKRKRYKSMKESYLLGYRECNKKWKEMSVQDICKRLERRKNRQ